MSQYRTYYYAICADCKRKQFICADIDILHSVTEDAITLARGKQASHLAAGLRGLTVSLLNFSKFVKAHSGHRVMLWEVHDDDLPYGQYEEEWPYDTETDVFVTPRWFDVKPPDPTQEMKRIAQLQSELTHYKTAYEQEHLIRLDMELKLAKNPEDVKRIREAFRTMAEQSLSVSQQTPAVNQTVQQAEIEQVPEEDVRLAKVKQLANVYIDAIEE